MGVVYRVWDQVGEQEVALKSLPLRTVAQDERRLVLLRTEFWAMTRLRHPNLPEVYDFGLLPDGTPYFTMELIPGVDLPELFPLPPHRLVPVFQQIAEALAFIHARHLVHRDVKSSNVRVQTLPDGTQRVVLMDFGLVSAFGTQETGAVSGTLAYMPPEVLGGAAFDARSDLFSLGILALEALTGQVPHRLATGSAPAVVAANGTHVELPATPGAPPAMVRLIRRLVSDVPARRPPNAEVVVDALVAMGGVEVSGTSGGRRGYVPTSSLVGREAEMGRLRASLDAVGEGRGGVVVVSGVAGAGKTRLLQEFRVEAQLRGFVHALGRGRETAASVLQPVLDALPAILAAVARPDTVCLPRDGPVLVPWAPALARLLPGVAPAPRLPEPAAELERLLAALRSVLLELSQQTPVVLVLDDLQWADGATVRLIEDLLGTAGSNGHLLVVGSVRSEEMARAPELSQILGRRPRALLELGSFDAPMLRALLAEQFGASDVADAFVQTLLRRSAGNAFFLHELLRWLVDNEVLSFAAGRWRLPESLEGIALPAGIDDVLRRRLSERSPEEVEILRLFAAADRPLDLWMLAGLLRAEGDEGAHSLSQRIDALRVHDLVAVDGEDCAVRHDRILEFAYEQMTEEQRRLTHRRVAAALEDARAHDPERYRVGEGELGLQYLRGGLDERAVDPLLRGADEAFRVQALGEAEELLRGAEAALGRLGEEAVGSRLDDVQELLVRSLYARSPTLAIPVLERFLERTRHFGLLPLVPRLRDVFGTPGQILGIVGTLIHGRLVARLPAERLRLVLSRFLRGWVYLCQGLAWSGRLAESRRKAELLHAYAPDRLAAARTTRLVAPCNALVFSGRIPEQQQRLREAYLAIQGAPAGTFPPYDQRAAVGGAVGAGLAMAGAMRSDPDALESLSLPAGSGAVVRSLIVESTQRLARVVFHAVRGELSLARTEFDRYLRSGAMVRPEEREEAEHWLALTKVDAGEPERARELARGFQHQGRRSEAWRSLILALTGGPPLGRLDAARRALSVVREPELGDALGEGLALCAAALAQIELGSWTSAREDVGTALAIAREAETRNEYLEILALRARAAVERAAGDHDAAVLAASEAAELATQRRNPVQRGLALLDLARAQISAGQEEVAEASRRRATEALEEIGNDHAARLARHSEGRRGLTTWGSTPLGPASQAPDLSLLDSIIGVLDPDELSRNTLLLLRELCPRMRPIFHLLLDAGRDSRTIELSGDGDLVDAPEALPLEVLAALADPSDEPVRLLFEGGHGWVFVLRGRAVGDDGEPADAPVVGLLYVPEDSARSDDVHQVRPYLTVVAHAFDAAQRFSNLRQREFRLTVLHQLGQVMNVVRSHDRLVDVILDRMVDIARADRAFLMVKDPLTGQLVFRSGRHFDRRGVEDPGFAMSRRSIGEAMESGQIVHVGDADMLATMQSVLHLSLKQITVVPLRSVATSLRKAPEEAEVAQRTLLALDPRELPAYLRSTAPPAADSIGVVYLETTTGNASPAPDLPLLRLLADQAGFALDITRLQERLVEEAAEQERLKHREAQLSRYLSAPVVEEVLANPNLLDLGGERREITVLFTDVRGFTRWSSDERPERVLAVLNRIFSVQGEVVFELGGTLDKFLGDGLMAIWGAPLAQPDHARRAVEAAIRMRDRLAELMPALGAPTLGRVGFGLHTGVGAVGNVGSSQRMEYTAIGDAVNLAARLCAAAQGGQVLVSAECMRASGLDPASFQVLPLLTVKGRELPVEVAEAR
jgi:class 3 adenylate cyclase/tetratricopeptide (TPR) repeat protein